MTSIALAACIVFIIYVMIWSLKNDGARSIDDQTGFLRMRDPAKEKPARGRNPAPFPAAPQAAKESVGNSAARRPRPSGTRKSKNG